MPTFPAQLSRRGRVASCHTPAREPTWEELSGGYRTEVPQTTCKAPMTSPSCAAAASLGLCHSPTLADKAFNCSLVSGKLLTKSVSDQVGRKILGCEGSRRQAEEVSVGIDNFQSQLFLPHSRSVSVSPVVSLTPPGRKTTVAIKELLPHLISSVRHRAGIWAIYSCHCLVVASSQLHVHLQLMLLRVSILSAFCTQLLLGYSTSIFQNAFAIFSSNILDVTRDAAPSWNGSLKTSAWTKSGTGRTPFWPNQHKPVWRCTKISLFCELVAALRQVAVTS